MQIKYNPKHTILCCYLCKNYTLKEKTWGNIMQQYNIQYPTTIFRKQLTISQNSRLKPMEFLKEW